MSLSTTEPEPIHAELMRYVRFSEDDARRLAAVRPHVAPAFVRLAQEFYERLREHEGAHAVFSGEDQIARLQRSLVAWLEGVFGGVYDDAYFARIERIGQAHVRVGLPQRYVVAAMAVLRSSLTALIDRHADAAATRDALCRLLDVELALMLDSHHEHVLARVDRAAQLPAGDGDQLHVLERAPVLVVGLATDGTITLVNGATEQATGWARDELLGRSFVDLLVAEDRRAEIAPKLAAGALVDVPLRTRAGKRRVVRFRMSTASRDRGGLVGFGADVTEEDERREQENRRLRLAAAGTLVAGLAHEIRNPLNGASLHLAFLERALTKSGTAEAVDAVRTVGGELRRLAALVTDFLEFARPKALAFAPVEARRVCERAIQERAADAAAAGVALATDFPTNEVVLDADGPRLEQVIGHLLDNAIEALRASGGRVTVRLRREPRHAWIEVEDDGPGLGDANAPIFDAFYSTKPDGTGLGLAIVHRIVSEHEGAVDVDSRPGSTRFRLKLPLTRQGTQQ
ncbi:MAG: PAS domain-containing protein [Labilithrix sp.]|nr:PAS domain-containing protein [Labilithrix sp.]MCW5812545.1 PAS domain-containing protein [Labilithrix sp.]